MDKIKLYLINGALGAGKTTLVDWLLSQENFVGSRVIENEFALTSVDTAIVEKRASEVAAIAGVCVCCSDGDELIDALRGLVKTGDQPVIIESTGVAHTLKVLEKLVVNDIFDHYDLVQSLYVLDAAEAAAQQISEQIRIEAEAADLVLVSKLDLLSRGQQQKLLNELKSIGISKIVKSDYGRFDLDELVNPSRLLGYFAEFDGEIHLGDTPTYSVIDTTDIDISFDEIEEVWNRLRVTYSLRRLKGDIANNDQTWHIEATPSQFVGDSSRPRQVMKIVLIGQKAHEITRRVFIQELEK